MGALLSYAIMTMEQARNAAGVGTSRDRDPFLTDCVNAVTRLVENIENILARQVVKRNIVHAFSGDGTNTVVLDNDINAADSSDLTVVYNEDGDEVPDASVKYQDFGEVYLDDGYYFEVGYNNCSVTFPSGFDTVPADLFLAARIILKKLWNLDEREGERIASISREGQTVYYRNEDIPKEAMTILNNYISGTMGTAGSVG